MTRTTQTLPAETGGTDITRFSALHHGVLSRYTVLPWESADEYRAVVEALVSPSIVRRARPRSTSSRRSPASSGASGGFALLRLPRIGAGCKER